MRGPCPCALGSINVGAKRWTTRADLFDQLRDARIYLDTADLSCVTLKKAAEQASLSEFHFSRVFRDAIGLSPLAYLHRRRFDHAVQRLLASNDTILQIAIDCGYQNPSAFTRAFSREFGQSPTACRKLARLAQP